MRLSCPAGSTPPVLRPSALSSRDGANKVQPIPVSSSFQFCQEQTNRLSGLYKISKNRNNRLLQLSLNLSRDINFIKEYCKCLQLELERMGFYRQKRIEKMSRRQTAASIFDSYSDTSSLIEDWRSEEDAEVELSRLRSINLNLENQNKQLLSRVGKETSLRISIAVQVDNNELQRLRREHQQAQDKIGTLSTEVSKLRHVNGVLELQQRRRDVQTGILEASKQVFGKIHEIMRDYRRRMSALAYEKRDIQRKYFLLKQNIRLIDGGCQLKLIELLNEKVDILSKLVEKQQIQLQNTISVYQSQLSKIQERRREELQFFQNQRLGLESQNLRLCIDVQKVLNRQDSTNLLLMQQKNTSERLTKEVVKLTQDKNTIEFKEKGVKGKRLKLESGVFKFYGENFKSAEKSMDGSSAKMQCRSAGYQFSHDENQNQSNFQYQFSEMSGSRPLQRPPDMHRRPEEREEAGYKGLQKIRVTYNSYLGPGVRMAPHGPYGRFYDSAVQYKRRLVQSKPDTSSNKR